MYCPLMNIECLKIKEKIIIYCLSNAVHGIGQILNNLSVHLSVCLSVCPQYRSSTIATVVFVRSSNLERISHT